jgi:hypothetical protein
MNDVVGDGATGRCRASGGGAQRTTDANQSLKEEMHVRCNIVVVG